MALEQVRITDPVKASDVQRFQDNVASEFRSLESPTTLPVQVVQWTAANPLYKIRETDLFIIVNSRPGPMKIVLPVPNRATQAVQILNAFDSNPVTIVQADGAAMANGSASIVLAGFSSAQMVTDGRAWYRYGKP